MEYIEPEANEAELIRQAKEGDNEAAGYLYSLHADDIKAQLRHLFNGMDEEAAEDLAQDTFVRALGGLERFEDQGYGLRPWLGRIAHNLFVDQYRRSNSIKIEAGDGFIECFPSGENVERYALGAIALEQTLECLQDQQKELMTAICIDGMSVKEYAEKNGLNPVSVRARMYRIRTHLRQLRDDNKIIGTL